MTKRAVIAVDCSTTAAKALVLDEEGTVLAEASSPLSTKSPAPGRAEQDATTWWTATDAAITAALQQIADRSIVEAVCISHQRESFVCLDADGEPLRPAMLWLDGRAADQVAHYGSDEVERISGKPTDITPGLYKLAWLKDEEPETLARTAKVVDVHGFLAHALTGHWVTSTASMDPVGLLDLQTRDYSPVLLDVAGLRREQLPELVGVGAPMGVLKPDVAARWGVSHDVKVIAGLGDGQAAGVGAGVSHAGEAYLVMGTAVVIGALQPGYVPSRAYRSLVSPLPRTTTVETFSSSGTFLTTWFRSEFGDPELGGRPDPRLEEAACGVPVGAEGLLTLPHWNATQTPYWDALTSGAVLGWRGCHTRAHFYRSLLEGIAMELRTQLDGLEQATGQRIETMRAIGGGTRSRLWSQILADVLARPVDIRAEGEISALGAGAVALAAIGVHADVQTASKALEVVEKTVRPIPENVEAYARLLPTYRQLYPTLRDVLHALHV